MSNILANSSDFMPTFEAMSAFTLTTEEEMSSETLVPVSSTSQRRRRQYQFPLP
jgi:hypothetical protein